MRDYETDEEGRVTAAEAQKIRGMERHQLIGDLALGELTHEQLGIKYDKRTKTISNFSSRNKAAVDERRRQIGNELVGIWVADKALRIVNLQDQADRAMGHQVAMEEAAAAAGDLVDEDRWGRLMDRIMKAQNYAAEELGHLPTRNPGDGPAVVHLRHTVVGVDPERDFYGMPESELSASER